MTLEGRKEHKLLCSDRMANQENGRKISRLEVKNLTALVGESILFEDLNMKLNSGTIAILYGPRGSGKSAFLRSLARLNMEVYPNITYTGKILLDDVDAASYKEKELRQIVTYIDTNFLESLDYLNFRELIRLAFGDHFKFNIEEYASELDEFGVLKALYKFEKTPLSSLYVLEKIGLLLFIASLRNSSVLVFDCILDHLDDEHVEFVTKMLKDISQNRIIILATRTLKRFIGLGDVLTIMKSGKILYEGDPNTYILEGIE
ncbi:MAG TPA: ATP-binding cassette domain-containing protein [Fervidobacterium sp.]|nr:ATP-binding cassette domain-containing protein [Fervidobacterium sp.]